MHEAYGSTSHVAQPAQDPMREQYMMEPMAQSRMKLDRPRCESTPPSMTFKANFDTGVVILIRGSTWLHHKSMK